MKYVVGNWKMNGTRSSIGEIARMSAGAEELSSDLRLGLCVPNTLLAAAATYQNDDFFIGAQDSHHEPKGAFTGDVSAGMLVDAGARAVILGHSERRQHYHETDELIARKIRAAVQAGLSVILCVGETLTERQAGQALNRVCDSFFSATAMDGDEKSMNLSVAYEPIWAIGTGMTASIDDIVQIHDGLRESVAKRFPDLTVPLLYGGSVNPENAAMLGSADNVDGFLVGGASLEASSLLAICQELSNCQEL